MIAPERGLRPGAGRGRIQEATEEELADCPFCAGREDRTPPETLSLGDPWRVRVVPNLYPAFERQEVVIHSREHKRSFAELDDEEVELVAQAWSERRRADRGGYLHACVNEGPDAGASLAHSHSQLAWLPIAPPRVAEEDESALAALLEPGELEVELEQDIRAVCPAAGRAPYEVLIGNGNTESDDPFGSGELPIALGVVRSVIRRLRAVEGPVPWNCWLHVGARRWHIELVPRLTVFAALELGAGIYINPLAPEQAARRLRESKS